ncbi:sodium/calcium exchanger family protein [Striga asiatica]|uniref:Sodium/calcium exchanger family protein n=1 Tax=Striga asiatica TaxID=4170 RepID=A0A5A7QNB2_STRAF|nr:sodium/calcium exchanger family protein [Striga asiatica]
MSIISALSGSVEAAQQRATLGMGLVAGYSSHGFRTKDSEYLMNKYAKDSFFYSSQETANPTLAKYNVIIELFPLSLTLYYLQDYMLSHTLGSPILIAPILIKEAQYELIKMKA